MFKTHPFYSKYQGFWQFRAMFFVSWDLFEDWWCNCKKWDAGSGLRLWTFGGAEVKTNIVWQSRETRARCSLEIMRKTFQMLFVSYGRSLRAVMQVKTRLLLKLQINVYVKKNSEYNCFQMSAGEQRWHRALRKRCKNSSFVIYIEECASLPSVYFTWYRYWKCC